MDNLKKVVSPLVWLTFFLLLGGILGLNAPFVLLVIAIIIHLI